MMMMMTCSPSGFKINEKTQKKTHKRLCIFRAMLPPPVPGVFASTKLRDNVL